MDPNAEDLVAESNERDLTNDQRKALDEAARWELEAMAALGVAHLEYQEMRKRYDDTAARLHAAEIRARQTEKQRQNVMGGISAMLELGPGEWKYDATAGKLVKQEGDDAKPT